MATELDLTNRKTLVASLPHGGVVAEIGVAFGQFSEVIWQLNEPRELYLIDCWEHQSEEVYGHDPSNVPNEVQLGMYAGAQKQFSDRSHVHVLRAYSLQAVHFFGKGFFDWIYLDANHLQLPQDLKAWYPRVARGGWFAGHDYTMAGDFITVKRDVDKFVADHGLELFVTHGDGDVYETNYPSWAFRKP